MSKIAVDVRLNDKIKHISVKKTTKISELAEKLKQYSNKNDDQINIELFYGGRFLNPDFTLEQINYSKQFPIDVFTSSESYSKWYNDLNTSCLCTTNLDDNDLLAKTIKNEDPDNDLIATVKMNNFLKQIDSKSDKRRLEAQAMHNNVHPNVMYLLYIENGKDLKKTLSFFNEDKKFIKQEKA